MRITISRTSLFLVVLGMLLFAPQSHAANYLIQGDLENKDLKGFTVIKASEELDAYIVSSSLSKGAVEDKIEVASDENILIARQPVVYGLAEFDPSFNTSYTRAYTDQLTASWVWPAQTGQGITVAVIDSGTNAVADLSGKVLQGRDIISGTPGTVDDHNHGTEVASVIASPWDNTGMQGMAPGVNILPVKVLNASNSGTTIDIAEGIHWAADNGADVINLSLGAESDPFDIMRDALIYAESQGVVSVCSAGNGGAPDDGKPDYVLFPAASPECIAVGSVKTNPIGNRDQKSAFSSFGPEVDVSAPGESLLVVDKEGSYMYASGTSFSAPVVSSLAALMKAEYPSCSPSIIRSYISSHARDVGAVGFDNDTGNGVASFGNVFNVMSDPWSPTPFTPILRHGIDASCSKLPENDVLPQITGTVQEGETLSCTQGTWRSFDSPIYTYDWLRDGFAINGEHNTTLSLSAADVNTKIKCKVRATDSSGYTQINSLETTSVTALGSPTDVCANIAGVQLTIPDGMIQSGGDCITPPPADLCANIAGIQATIPDGMIQSGVDCITPQVDLCANIAGVQLDVPDGMIQSGADCLTPPVDLCANIAGMQALVPDGMVQSGANCITMPPDDGGTDNSPGTCPMRKYTITVLQKATINIDCTKGTSSVYSMPAGSTLTGLVWTPPKRATIYSLFYRNNLGAQGAIQVTVLAVTPKVTVALTSKARKLIISLKTHSWFQPTKRTITVERKVGKRWVKYGKSIVTNKLTVVTPVFKGTYRVRINAKASSWHKALSVTSRPRSL